MFFELAEKDPKFWVQLVSAIELAEQVSEDAPAKIEKVSTTEITSQVNAENKENIQQAVTEFLDIYHELSDEERKVLLEQIKKGY